MPSLPSVLATGVLCLGLSSLGCHSSSADTPADEESPLDASVHQEPDLGARDASQSTGDAGTDLAAPKPPEVIQTGLTEPVTSSAIAVSASGLAQVVLSTDTSIIYLGETKSGWVRETVLDKAKTSAPVAIALRGDIPWVSFPSYDPLRSSYQVEVAHREATGWKRETVISDLLYPSDGGAPLGITPSGSISLFYTIRVRTSGSYADYVVRMDSDGSKWGSLGYLQTGRPHALATDAKGLFAMVYYDQALTVAPYLGFAPEQGAPWIVARVEATAAAGPGRLAFDSLDGIHLLYCDKDSGELRYANSTTDGGGWRINPLEKVGTAFLGIGIARGDTPTIAYYQPGAADVRFGRRTLGRWQIETVDQEGDVGKALSLTMDRSGQAHIVYYDTTKQRMKRLTR